MTPEDQQSLTTYSREIAKILHRNAPQEAIQTLEEIEKTIRGQLLDHVSPEIALFLSKLKPDLNGAENEK
jgi:transposase